MALTATCGAQLIEGAWVDATEQAIDELRKSNLHVLVLDRQGRPVPAATVSIRLLRHDFPFGVTLDADEFANGGVPPLQWATRPVYRCFNSVSLQGAASWEMVQPTPQDRNFQMIDRMLDWSDHAGLSVRWGRVISADIGRLPPWVAPLRGEDLADAVEVYMRGVLSRYGRRVEQFDLYCDLTNHDHLEAQLGVVMVRRLYEMAQAGAPRARLAIRFDDSLYGERSRNMIIRVTHMRESFVPIDVLALDVRLSGKVIHGNLWQALRFIAGLNLPIVICGLEISGPTTQDAAANLEVAMRTFFAHPSIEGVWFGGIRHGRVADPVAAMLDEEGRPTASGLRLEGLVRHIWWNEETIQTDELGNARKRVFAGLHDVVAVLPDGSAARTSVYLKPREQRQRVVLQPLKLEEASQP
jgi:endo-1,4-beta-xylanase